MRHDGVELSPFKTQKGAREHSQGAQPGSTSSLTPNPQRSWLVPVFPGHFFFMPLKLSVSGISMPVSPLPSFNQQKPCHLVPSQPHAVPAITCHLGFSKQGSPPSPGLGLLSTLISHVSLPSPRVLHCWLGLVCPTLTLIWDGYQGLLASSQEGSEGHPRSMFLNLHHIHFSSPTPTSPFQTAIVPNKTSGYTLPFQSVSEGNHTMILQTQ